ncbi:hypothetical protein [Cysteiniphilum sp. QT6929]|uniref:hypothetical protein n=1 Tax=Cysteiniphilum sp. QT6929 TaxID=2975055 RepID=UPI0024B3BA5C|nr:hypothetical protein [Cysteiniphilum sp. QT6929]WHN66143.1 hypothetical protein NYP54_02635 [Cysteiniphilum sp. QT6929]
MTDTPFRKTLSLKRKKPAETTSKQQSDNASNTNNHPNINNAHGRNNNASQHNHRTNKPKRHFQEQEVSFSTQKQQQNSSPDHVAFLAKNDPLLQNLQKKRDGLLEQIKVLEQRLVFISSEPLQAACNELKKEDTAILCQINDYLISKQ